MNTIEPTNALISLVSLFIAPHLADIVGSYAVIILASTAGAGWSLGREGGNLSIWRALLYFARINLTAILITVVIANIISSRINIEDPQWLLAPISFIIGLIGNEWSNMSIWAADKIKSLFSKFTRGD